MSNSKAFKKLIRARMTAKGETYVQAMTNLTAERAWKEEAPSGKRCESCGTTVLPLIDKTGMCGPCTFGEAAMAFGD